MNQRSAKGRFTVRLLQPDLDTYPHKQDGRSRRTRTVIVSNAIRHDIANVTLLTQRITFPVLAITPHNEASGPRSRNLLSFSPLFVASLATKYVTVVVVRSLHTPLPISHLCGFCVVKLCLSSCSSFHLSASCLARFAPDLTPEVAFRTSDNPNGRPLTLQPNVS